MHHERTFRFNIEGEIAMKETINFTLQVNPGTTPPPAFLIVDANGGALTDGTTVALTAETVGVADPGQVLFTVSGGVAPYSFALVPAGSTPPGDVISSVVNADGSETVSLAGTPTTAGPLTFGIDVSDSSTPANVAKLSIKRVS
jgi:hypothetical protein